MTLDLLAAVATALDETDTRIWPGRVMVRFTGSAFYCGVFCGSRAGRVTVAFDDGERSSHAEEHVFREPEFSRTRGLSKLVVDKRNAVHGYRWVRDDTLLTQWQVGRECSQPPFPGTYHHIQRFSTRDVYPTRSVLTRHPA